MLIRSALRGQQKVAAAAFMFALHLFFDWSVYESKMLRSLAETQHFARV